MEIAWGVLDLCCFYRILRLYLKKNTTILLLPLLFAVSYSSWSFYWGGSAEELMLPALLWPLYLLLRCLEGKEREPVSMRALYFIGICAGYVACIKFTVLGFFLGAMFLVMLRADVRQFLKSCLIFLGGMLTMIAPWIIYFGIRGGLADWYRVYIYTNVFLYSTFGANTKGEGIGDKLYNLSKILYWLIRSNAQYFLFVIIGMVDCVLHRASWIRRLSLPVLFLLTFVGIYIGGATLPYYALPLSAFTVAGMIPVGRFVQKIRSSVHTSMISSGHALTFIVIAASILLSLLLTLLLTPNKYYLSYTKEDLFLTRFAEDIRRDQKPGQATTLLNYNCLDCGLYTAADIYPTCYWFQSQTLPIDDVDNEQKRYAREGQTDYIVVRNYYPESFLEKYEEIDSFHQVMGEEEFDYLLLRRR